MALAPVRRTLQLLETVPQRLAAGAPSPLQSPSQRQVHDEVLGQLLSNYGGLEIDRADAILLMFTSADAAVGFALAYQTALIPFGLRARVGMHEGEVVLVQNSAEAVSRGAKPLELEGLAKPLAARVFSVAGPGQCLLSAAARGGLTGPVDVVSHGDWVLKGVEEPVELFEVGGSDAPFLPPLDAAKAYRVVATDGGWTRVRDLPANLPGERDAFVGRNPELTQLWKMVSTSDGWVTLVGSGGVGKTRLACRFATRWLGEFPGGVWFCDLTDASSADGFGFEVARGLGLSLGSADPKQTLGRAIAGLGTCLVILDNVEQLPQVVQDHVEQWRQHAPAAVFLLTSRASIGGDGERVFPLAPLCAEDSVALFVDRARLSRPDFVLTADDLPVVDELLRLLDDLPLAIELAAARVRMLPPAKLLLRIGERFKLLSGGRRRNRKATLRGMLDWSWSLLGPDERIGLAQLSVFEGGLSAASARDVLRLEEREATEVLKSLVQQSLVRETAEGRYLLMVTVQAYGQSKLEAPEPVYRRHSAHYAAQYLAMAPRLDSRDGLEVHQYLMLNLANLVTACRRSVALEDWATAVALLEAASHVLVLRGPYSLLVDLAASLERVAALTDRQRLGVVRILAFAELSRFETGPASVWFEQAFALCARLDDPETEARLWIGEGRSAVRLREYERAEKALRRALLLYQSLGDRCGEGVAFGNLGVLRDVRGNFEEAATYYEKSIALHREVGVLRKVASGVSNLGMLYNDMGRFDAAKSLLEQGLGIHQQVENRRGEANVLSALARLHAATGVPAKAIELSRAAVSVHQRIGNPSGERDEWGRLAGLLLRIRELDEARACCERALGVYRKQGNGKDAQVLRRCLADVERAAGHPALSERQAQLALDGAKNDRDVALARLCLGRAWARLGRTAEALELLRQARFPFQKDQDAAGEHVVLAALAIAGAPEVTVAEMVAACGLARGREDGERLGRMTLALAFVHHRLGDEDRARQALEDALEVTPVWAALVRAEINEGWEVLRVEVDLEE